jgi:hypothetical protein
MAIEYCRRVGRHWPPDGKVGDGGLSGSSALIDREVLAGRILLADRTVLADRTALVEWEMLIERAIPAWWITAGCDERFERNPQ